MAFFNYRRFNDCMAEGGSPSVYTVDTHASRPPLPPRLNQKPKRSGQTQILLFLLVSLAFCILFIEACIIYFLHQPDALKRTEENKQTNKQPTSSISDKRTGDEKFPTREFPPSKPVAHLTGGPNDHDSHIMAWDEKPEPLIHELRYEDKSLIFEKTGYYYVYSKVIFSESKTFYHSIQTRTRRYEKPIILLQSRKYSPSSNTAMSNSFLGGVFYFEENDAVFVNVSDTKQITIHTAVENVFGVYMI